LFILSSKFEYPTALRWWLALVLICCAVTSIHAQETTETKPVGDDMFAGTQQAASDKPTIKPIRTDSPRATLTSFLRLRDELEETLQTYRSNKSRELAEKLQVINAQRHVLVKFREMLHAHPKIHSDTVSVRFAGFGQSSLDIGVRIYNLKAKRHKKGDFPDGQY
jgi:hypothetical protein